MTQISNLIPFYEPFDEKEIAYLQQLKQLEDARYKKLISICFRLITTLLLVLGSIIFGLKDEEEKLTYTAVDYLGTCLGTYILVFGIIFIFRKSNKNTFARDLMYGQKLIQPVNIERKLYNPQDSKCYFYLKNSPILHIAVNVDDYEFYNVEDEINLEIAPFTKTYLGYY